MRLSTCPSADVLARIGLGRRVSGAAVAHVEACASCARVLRLAQKIEPTSITAEDAAAVDAEVESLLAELLAVDADSRPQAAGQERYMVPSLARRFIDLAEAEWSRDLRVAHLHIHVATVISSNLTRRLDVAAEIEFDAWKNRSTILRELGHHDSARAALMYARGVIPKCSDRDLKYAIIQFADACLCAMRDAWEPQQARSLLDACEPVFWLREPERVLAVQSLRGTLALCSADYADALALYSGVAAAVDARDEAGWADAQRNVVNALIRMRRLAEAEALLRRVRRIDRSRERTLEVVKDDALAALLAEQRGDFAHAAEGYGNVRRRFSAAGETESALLAGKSEAVALVAVGDASGARDVLASLLTADVVRDTDRRRFTADALAYLRDLADRAQLTPDVAGEVGRYIDRIHAQRAVPFTRPMPLLTM